MLFVRTFVAPSKIHGLGLFADEAISKGTLVSKWTRGWDVCFSAEDLQKLPPLAKDFVEHFGWLADDVGHISLDNSRYINHAIDHPNLEIAETGGMKANRDIRKGEELLENYETYCCAY